MFGAVGIEEILNCPDENLTKEFFGDRSWRVLPLDALPSEKFVADMVFDSLDFEMFPGDVVAHGRIYNDSRGIFFDGERVRTSSVKQIVEVGGQMYVETRNTMYRLIDKP